MPPKYSLYDLCLFVSRGDQRTLYSEFSSLPIDTYAALCHLPGRRGRREREEEKRGRRGRERGRGGREREREKEGEMRERKMRGGERKRGRK